ncbi:MAG: MFS transporter [Gammaproteobacteria bacterium]|jgi:GPH family glycoside/pentoside/hexuronide:cation symporter|nr:MFS transporter [Gammaproteobacteria bacterium]NBX39836.1 MFS transporter [Gammaproteobacteria bacterium]
MTNERGEISSPGWKLNFGWGIGTLGASILLNSFAALQLYYLTNVLGIAIATASLVLFVAKIWDWIANPLMGLISDRTQTRWGRRRPYLLLGGFVAGGAFIVFFTSALTPISGSLVLVALSLALVGTGYTIFNVPYMAMPSELVDDYKERTKMISWRVFFIGIGTMVGVSTQRMAELLGDGAEGYARMALYVGASILVFMGWTFWGTAGGRAHARDRQSVPFFEQLRLGLQNKPFAALLGTKFTQLFGLFTSTAMSIFVVKYVLGKENPGEWMILFTLVSFLAQTASIPLWTRMTKRFEKRATYMVATVMFSVASLTWLLASPDESMEFFCLRATIKGFAAGGLLLMGQSMLPDTIEYDFRKTGLRREGIFSGLYSIVEKVASSFAPTLLGLGYAWFGFQSKAPTQTVEAIDGIRYCAAFLPCLYFALSMIPLYFYRLTERELKATGNS